VSYVAYAPLWSVTDDDDRVRQTITSKTILACLAKLIITQEEH